MNSIKNMVIQKNKKEVNMQIRGGKLEYSDKDEQSKKISRIILTAIVLVFIVIIAIICTILYLQKSVLKTYIDGQAVSINERNYFNRCRY